MDVNEYPVAVYKSDSRTYQLKGQLSTIESAVFKLLECSLTVLFSFKLDYSAASAFTLFILENVDSNNIASSTHMVF